jgi:hypothetical protein
MKPTKPKARPENKGRCGPGGCGVCKSECKSASNLDPTPIVHQVVEAEAELSILGMFDRRPTVTPRIAASTNVTL